MSPRSDELLASAHEWLAAAEAALRSGFPGGAAADAYYAVLYAARAALSEADRYAKTHHGVWALFGESGDLGSKGPGGGRRCSTLHRSGSARLTAPPERHPEFKVAQRAECDRPGSTIVRAVLSEPQRPPGRHRSLPALQ